MMSPEFVPDETVIDEVDVKDIIGDVSSYVPKEIEEPERREPIGSFDCIINSASISTGETNGRKWANVQVVAVIDDMGVFPARQYITLWLGNEPPLYPEGCEQTQTEIFLDMIHTAGLEFDAGDFNKSVEALTGKKCRIRSWVMKKKDKETGKMEVQINDKGYKKYKAKLIAPDSLPTDAPF